MLVERIIHTGDWLLPYHLAFNYQLAQSFHIFSRTSTSSDPSPYYFIRLNPSLWASLVLQLPRSVLLIRPFLPLSQLGLVTVPERSTKHLVKSHMPSAAIDKAPFRTSVGSKSSRQRSLATTPSLVPLRWTKCVSYKERLSGCKKSRTDANHVTCPSILKFIKPKIRNSMCILGYVDGADKTECRWKFIKTRVYKPWRILE